MAKNNWGNSDYISRSKMNQPFWVASGTVAAGGDATAVVRLFVSPGSMRFPTGIRDAIGTNGPGLVSNAAMSSVAFGPTIANYGYSLFVRSDGSFMISGASTTNSPSLPPRYDAECIGWVRTGNPNNTGNLLGPWNDTTKEARGQYVAITSTVPRLVFSAKASGANPWPVITTNSGLAFLSVQNPGNGGAFGGHSAAHELSGLVQWYASGVASSRINARFGIIGYDSLDAIVDTALFADTFDIVVASNPYAADAVNRTFAFSVVVPQPTAVGYELRMYPAVAPYAGQASLVSFVKFSCKPIWYASDTNEPA